MRAAGTERITTSRLTLRRFEEGDAGDIYGFMGDEEVMRYMPQPVIRSGAVAQRTLEAWLAGYASPFFLHWAVEYGGRVAGCVSLTDADVRSGSASLSFCLKRSLWGGGIMTEAAEAVIAFGLERCGLEEVRAECMSENIRAAGVLKRCGMSYEGEVRARVSLLSKKTVVCRSYKIFSRY